MLARLCSKPSNHPSAVCELSLSVVQAGIGKGRETRDKITNIHWIIEKATEFKKNTCSYGYEKAFDCMDHNNCGKFLKMGVPDPHTCLLGNLYVVKKQQSEPDIQQLIGSNLGKEYDKAVYCHLDFLSYMQSILWESTSWKMPGWMNHKLESRLPAELSATSDMQITPL